MGQNIQPQVEVTKMATENNIDDVLYKTIQNSDKLFVTTLTASIGTIHIEIISDPWPMRQQSIIDCSNKFKQKVFLILQDNPPIIKKPFINYENFFFYFWVLVIGIVYLIANHFSKIFYILLIPIVYFLLVPYLLYHNMEVHEITSNKMNARSTPYIIQFDSVLKFLFFGEYFLQPKNNPKIDQKIDSSQNLIQGVATKEIKFYPVIPILDTDPIFIAPEHRGLIVKRNKKKRLESSLTVLYPDYGPVTYINKDIPETSFSEFNFEVKKVRSRYGSHYLSVSYSKKVVNLSNFEKYKIITLMDLEKNLTPLIENFDILKKYVRYQCLRLKKYITTQYIIIINKLNNF